MIDENGVVQLDPDPLLEQLMNADYVGLESVRVKVKDLMHMGKVLKDRLQGIRRISAARQGSFERYRKELQDEAYNQCGFTIKKLERELKQALEERDTLHCKADRHVETTGEIIRLKRLLADRDTQVKIGRASCRERVSSPV